MYRGINLDGIRVSNYDTACQAHEQRRNAGRMTENGDWALGHPKAGVTGVNRRADGAIEFRLYATNVVVWNPDNSVDIDNYGTKTTGVFAHALLPRGISLSHQITKQGAVRGFNTIEFKAAANDDWWDWHVCQGDIVRFRPHGDVWLPDEDTLDELKFPELDQSKARALAKRLHLKDFENWLAMAPIHLDIEHDEYNLAECIEALARRDFRRAAETLPLIEVPSGFGLAKKIKPLRIDTVSRDCVVTMSSLRKLKLALWDEDGLFTTVTRTTLPRAEYERRMKRVREMAALNIHGQHYGPHQ